MKVICSFIIHSLGLSVQSECRLCAVPGAEDTQRTDETGSKQPGVRVRLRGED